MEISLLTDRIRASEWFYRMKRRQRAALENPYRDFHAATKSIFIHIPKAGGMSVMKCLYGIDRQLGHPPAITYYTVDPAAFRSAFVFTIVREPISRFKSAYSFLKSGGINPLDKAFAEENLFWDDLDDAVRAIEAEGLWPRLMRWMHFRPQCHYLAGAENDKPYRVDFFGRQDRMQESLDVVCRTLKMPLIEAQPVNTTMRTISVDLSDKSREILSRVYRQDFRLWDRVVRSWPAPAEGLRQARSRASHIGNLHSDGASVGVARPKSMK